MESILNLKTKKRLIRKFLFDEGDRVILHAKEEVSQATFCLSLHSLIDLGRRKWVIHELQL